MNESNAGGVRRRPAGIVVPVPATRGTPVTVLSAGANTHLEYAS
jgi:hypothetical protein